MSNQPQQPQQQGAQNQQQPKNAQEKAKEEIESEEEGYSCAKCCRGYESCIVWTVKVRIILIFYLLKFNFLGKLSVFIKQS